MTRTKWIKLIIGCTAFGFLMGVRPEFHQMWFRVVIAAVAGIVMALTIAWVQRSTH